MSDFDAALERLVADPAFRDALAADPARALAGYELSADELELLSAQVDTGTGGQRHVEQRTSKASLFGLLTPMSGGGLGGGALDPTHGGGAGPSYAPADGGYGSQEGFGPAGGGTQGLGAAGQSQEGFGPAGSGGDGSLGSAFGGALTDEPPAGRAPEYVPPGEGPDSVDQMSSTRPPAGYHTRVDADGDGRWDRFTAVDRGDQGVDLVVDRDGDGRAEFVGHDYDRDGLIDEADTDENRDGQLDTRWVDDNGDGWLDRRAGR